MRLSSGGFKATILCIAILQSASSLGSTVYRYTYHGAPEYELVTPGMSADLDILSGYIDFSAPLSNGFNDDLAPVAYSFTDGITTVTEDSGYNLRYSFFDTDETGKVIDYALHLEFILNDLAESRRHILFLIDTFSENTVYCPDVCTAENAASDGDIAFTTDFAGEGIRAPYWTSTVVPIPAAVWLFGSALAGLARFRSKQTN